MTQRLTRAKTVLRAVWREVRAENITFLAGSIAYHAFVSLLPFLLLMLLLLSRIGGEGVARDLVLAMAAAFAPGAGESMSTQEFAELLFSAAQNATKNAGLSVVTVAALVWGTLRIFRGLDQAFSEIYETEAVNTFVDQIVDGVAVFGAIGVAVFLVSAADALVGLPSFGTANVVVRPALSVVTIALALLPMYYVFPDENVTVREVVPGTLVAGAGWTALSAVFRFYVELSTTAAYGVVGVVILLITWLYFGGLVLLVGAAVNAVLAGRSEDVANIAWGRDDGDATADDAAFVAPLRELEAADWDRDVGVVVGDADVDLPPPDGATVTVEAVDRPGFMGGNRETGRVVLTWDSSAGE